MRDNEEAEAKIAEKLRELYIIRRNMHASVMRESMGEPSETLHPKWDGGRDSRHVLHKPIWPKLAKIAIERSLDPSQWIDALFANAFAFDHVPWPSDLTNKEVLKEASQWGVRTAEGAVHSVRTELINLDKSCFLLRTFGVAGDVGRVAASDPRTDASPLVRYAFAVERGYLDLAAGFEAQALAQFSAAPQAYKDALGKRLPQRIVDLHEGIKK